MKKISFTWLIFSVICIAFIAYTYKFIDNNFLIKNKSFKISNSIPINTVYRYSLNEINYLKEKNNYDDLEIKKQISMQYINDEDMKKAVMETLNLDENEFNEFEDNNHKNKLFNFKEKGKFKKSVLYFTDIFNEDLSLKNPEFFSGYTYVEKNVENALSEKFIEQKQKFNDEFYPALKYFDSKYKDSDGVKLGEIIQSSILGNSSNLLGGYNFNIDNLKNNGVLGDVLFVEKYLEDKDKTSTLPLIAFLNAKPLYHHFFSRIPTKELPSYEVYSEEYNYFNQNTDYYVNYYPKNITKIDSKTYIVDIETDKPVSNFAATLLFNNIFRNINVDSSVKPTFKCYDDIPFILVLRVNHKNLSGDMLPEYMYCTISPCIFNDSYSQIKTVGNRMFGTSTSTRPDWYPNETSQPWVKDFFNTMNNALENNSRFSIFETIENISKQYQASYSDVENVILSFYWRYIN